MRRQGALGRIGDGPRAPQLLWMAEIAPPAILLRSRRDCLFIPRLPPSPNVGLFGASGIVRSTFCLSRTELRWGPLQSFDQIQVSGTSRPGSSQLVAAQGLTCRSVARKAHCQNCTRFLLSRYGGDLLMRSICCDSYENGGSRSRTTNTSLAYNCALAITDYRNDLVPIPSKVILPAAAAGTNVPGAMATNPLVVYP